MDRKLPIFGDLYESVYGTDFPIDKYFVILFDCLPSKFTNKNFYNDDLKEYFLSNGFVEECNVNVSKKDYQRNIDTLLVSRKNEMIIKYQISTYKNDKFVEIDITYNFLKGSLESQLNFKEIESYKKEKKKSHIQLVRSDMGHLDTEEYDLPIPEIDLALNYGEDFMKVHNLIVKRLNNEGDKGIILLHGDPGTGKTTYLKYLTKLIVDKDILFIPPSMAEMLSEPSIIPFLMDNKNSILLIEDAERVISDRGGNGSPAGVSNILNLTDGILGDCLNIQVIATFNMEREKIDSALLRKGRLIAEHKFEKLKVDESNKLLKHLGKSTTTTVPLTLADIYNIDEEEYVVNKSTTKIGFQ